MSEGVWENTWRVLDDVLKERKRQAWLRDQGRFRYTLADEPGLMDSEKFACIAEEVGEVARCVLARARIVKEAPDAEKLRLELVQSAALCVAWIEALDAEAERDAR